MVGSRSWRGWVDAQWNGGGGRLIEDEGWRGCGCGSLQSGVFGEVDAGWMWMCWKKRNVGLGSWN